MKLLVNKCGYPHCWNYDCAEWCPHYKPRMFGFIPVSRKFGEWLGYIQEKIFFKFHVKEDPGTPFDFDFEEGEDSEQ